MLTAVSDSEISVETFLKTFQIMGYSVLRDEAGMVALNFSEEVRPIFFFFGTVSTLPFDSIELMLEENGIERPVFYAALESI